MESLNQIEELVIGDIRWREAAQGIVDYVWTVKDEAWWLAELMVRQHLAGQFSVGELRAGASWANALDAEACRVYGGDLTVGKQQLERTARRLLNHSGRLALKAVGSEHSRVITHVKEANNRKVVVG